MLKLLQARLQHYVNQELPDVQLGLEKEEEPELKLPTSLRLLKEQGEKKKKRAREFPKNIYFCFTDYAKAFDCMDPKFVESSYRDGNTRQPYLSPKKPACRSRSNS